MRPMLGALPSDSICSALAATCFLYLPRGRSALRCPCLSLMPVINAWHMACLDGGIVCTALPTRTGRFQHDQKGTLS